MASLKGCVQANRGLPVLMIFAMVKTRAIQGSKMSYLISVFEP